MNRHPSFPEHLRQRTVQLRFNGQDLLLDLRRGPGGFILVEIAGKGDFIAHAGLLLVHPRIRGKGQHFPLEVCLDILLEGHVFDVPQVGVRLGLALFEDQLPVFVPEGAFHGDLGVAKVRGVKNLADVALHKVAVQAGDFRDGAFRDVVALVAQGLAPLFVQAAGVDELHLARAASAGLLVGEQPDIGGNAGIVKDVVGQGDDGFQQVVFQDVFADVGGAAARVAGEEGEPL